MNELNNKVESIAQNILNLSIREILINFRFFNMGLDKFGYQVSNRTKSIGTDGEFIYFNPEYVIKNYQSSIYSVNKTHVHMLYHCLLKHPFKKGVYDVYRWGIACDIAVSFAVDELDSRYIPGENHPHREQIKKKIIENCQFLTAQHIYNYISKIDRNDLRLYQRLFVIDDHRFWYSFQESSAETNKNEDESMDNQNDKSEGDDTKNTSQNNNAHEENQTNNPIKNEKDSGNTKLKDMNSNYSNGNNNIDSQQNQQNDSHNSKNSTSEQESQNSNESSNNSGKSDYQQKLENEWEGINSMMQMDLKTFSRNKGMEKGFGSKMLQLENKDIYDYSEFLNKFAVYREDMRMDLDTFDYIFYTFGLDLYKNMPLIEPLEYKDSKKIYQFVIAIDTSGSVWGEDVKYFLNETYAILKSKESFHRKMDVHIIQCDADIQEDVVIHSQEEFDQYKDNYSVKGGGGTDFRPVFRYVDELIEQKQLSNLKGILYFTDGYGTFPNKRPKYETAFIFFKDAYTDVDVPPWAIKLILDKEELRRKR